MLALSLALTGVASAATLPEFKPVPTKKKFTSTGGTVTFRQAGTRIICAKSTTAGEILTAKTVGKLVVKFTGCERWNSGSTHGCPISSTNTKTAGEILTKSLKGELGTPASGETTSGVGLLLAPEEGAKWANIAEDECPTESERSGTTALTGSLAAEVPVIGKKQATNKLVFATSEYGTQKIESIKLDSGKIEEPGLNAWSEPITVENTDELSFEEALEVT
jgi:hypothetical protein